MTPFYNSSIKNFIEISNVILSEGNTLSRRRHSRRIERANSTGKSVNVKHDIIVGVQNDIIADDYNQVLQQVKDALDTVKNCSLGNACPNLNITAVNFTSTELDEKEFCKKATALFPEEFQIYYSPANVSGKLTCVTSCHQNHPYPKICMNRGTCGVSKHGPACYCLHTDANWYLGENCTFQISKVGVYAGMGVVAVVLVLTVAAVTAYTFINQRNKKRNKDNRENLVNQWLEDDFEWPQSHRPNTNNSVDTLTLENPAYSDEDFYRHQSNQIFRSSDPLPPTTTQQQVPLEYLHNKHPVRISRPQICRSFDI
ncbi:mucin-12-like [Hoplias malabaricus]|uniref:mucin-12-like n=1 Tax=Hoplias malabaricus TaxID=27720 RepID=UPI00346273C2